MKAGFIPWYSLAEQRLSPSFSVAVVYDDSNDHRRATTVCEFLVRELCESSMMTATWWRTPLLVDPKLSLVAARTAARSSLVLMSFQCRQEPTPALKCWLKSWPPPEERTPQLLALLHGAALGSTLSAWDTWLRSFARSRNIGYVDEGAVAFTQSHSALEWEPSSAIEPYPHWGLNE